ncbi:class I adenylate-forming enzyme family protein [Burkholderiaceae bacterium UC74_6]
MSFEDVEEAAFHDVPGLIGRHARQRPAAVALVEGDRRLDYEALDAWMDRVAAALQHEGLGPGDVIALCGTTSIEYLGLFLGALRAGLAVAPLAPGATPAQLAAMVRDAGASLLIVDAEAEAQIDAASAGLPLGLHRLSMDALEEWLAAEGAQPSPVTIQPEWAFNLIYSSGTTGTPKGIVQSHAMRWSQVRRAAAFGYGPGTVTLSATPLYSNTTLVSVLPALATGGAVVLMPKFDAARYLALAEAQGATHAMLVPVQYQRLLAHPDFDRADLSTLRWRFCTSAPFTAALKAEVLRRWPGQLIEYYGMTEGGGTCILPAHEFPDKLHTVGRPAEGHDIRLIDEEGRELAAGQVGEVVGRSGAMMTGYHGLPAQTAAAEWFDAEGRRYIRTGDVARFDEDGFLILLDRRKDLIISGGFNIYAVDLEAVLLQHPAVAEAAVIGIASPEWGETPVAVVVLKGGACAEAEALRQFVNERVGKTQRLSAVRLAMELPRNAIGKVLKRELRLAW